MLVTAAVYCRDLQYDLILDDMPLILMNETITSWKNWTTLFLTQIFPTQGADIEAVHYRPIYMLWLMANHQLFGMVIPWWHLTSLPLHLLVILLIYKLGVNVLREPWTAALAALLFAFHPIHVESVSYVSASTDLLVAVFMLVAFLAYFHSASKAPPDGTWRLPCLRPRWRCCRRRPGPCSHGRWLRMRHCVNVRQARIAGGNDSFGRFRFSASWRRMPWCARCYSEETLGQAQGAAPTA
jgi:hypothetical protein